MRFQAQQLEVSSQEGNSATGTGNESKKGKWGIRVGPIKAAAIY